MAIATGQVTVGTAATKICSERPGRRRVRVIQDGTVITRVGPAAVTMANGALLVGTAGQSWELWTEGEVWGIVGAGTNNVSFIEEY